MMKKPLIISYYDISKFFDKEILLDALDASYNAGVKGKYYRLLYMLNSETEIVVKTGVGPTDTAETNENVTQGSVEGAIVSSSNIDNGFDETFRQSYYEISYAEERLQPLLFQDDVA